MATARKGNLKKLKEMQNRGPVRHQTKFKKGEQQIHKSFTPVALFNIQVSISTKIALLRLLEMLIIKISFNFTFSAK
jgi:hypothetical protein